MALLNFLFFPKQKRNDVVVGLGPFSHVKLSIGYPRAHLASRTNSLRDSWNEWQKLSDNDKIIQSFINID